MNGPERKVYLNRHIIGEIDWNYFTPYFNDIVPDFCTTDLLNGGSVISYEVALVSTRHIFAL